MVCPSPVASRWRSAASTPNAPASAATPSPRAKPGSVGGPSGSPVRCAKPENASASVPKPGSEARGPVWPKPLTRTRTRPGLASCSASRPEAPALEGAGPEPLDEHVGVARQPQRELAAARVREVERHAALVAAHERPPEADALALRAEHAQRVAARVLDLDHLGAVVAEQRREQRPGDERRGVHHPQPPQRAGGRAVVRHAPTRVPSGSTSKPSVDVRSDESPGW